jgi:hypothetical protein
MNQDNKINKEAKRKVFQSVEELMEIVNQLEKEKSELLNAVQMAYRKHHRGDDFIGWEELSDLLHDALFNTMGHEELEKWRVGLK